MSKLILLLVPILSFAYGTVAYAQWFSNPSVNNAICRAANNQNLQQIISDGKGGAIICWNDERVQASSSDIYAQRIDKDGFIRWVVNGIVVSAAPFSQSKPEMVSDGVGGAIIVWTDNRYGINDVYAQRIDSSGNILWAENGVPVAEGSSGQSDLKIISDDNHGIIVTWIRKASSGPGAHIYAQRMDGNGNLLWDQAAPVSTRFISQNKPTIASDGDGGAYIAWAHYTQSNYDIYAQRIDSNGVAYWQNNGIPIATGSTIQDAPMIVADGAGNAFLAYSDYGSGSIPVLQVVVLKKSGSMAASFRATSTSGGQTNQHLSNIGTGLLGIAWEDRRVAGKMRSYAQIIDTTGKKYWTANGVEISDRSGDQATPFIISDGDGGVIVAWEDKTLGALQTDIYAQRISEDGSLLWSSAGVPVCTAGNPQQFPRMISDDENGAIITWEDFRPSFSNVEVYASRILSDGSFPIEPPILAFSTKTVDFGVVDLSSSATQDITLSNTGGLPITIDSVTSSDPQFSLTPESSTIDPGGNITAAAKFQPDSKSTYNAFIVVQSNSVFGPDTISVTGQGSASALILTDKSSLDFGNVEVGSNKSLAIHISNPGSDTLTISSITTSDPEFTMTISSKVLAPGASFDDTVRFTPTSPGPVSADLTLTSNAPTSPTVLPMTGTGVGVVTMTIEHADISFGEVAVGAYKDTTLSITNTGNDTLRISSFTSGNPSFSVETLITTIAPAGIEIFTLRFEPDAAGPVSTIFSVTSNSLTSPDTITVDGIGVLNPMISFAPVQLSFGSVPVGDEKDIVLTISNIGGLNLTVSAITSTHADFSALLQQFEVPSGSSFDETIRFTPSTLGDRSGILLIESNAASSPDTVIVFGTGTDVSPVWHTEVFPGVFTLSQNYPNPFNPSTSIDFSIPRLGNIRLSVFDHLGREIAVLAEGEYRPGVYTCRFDAAEHVSGMYVYRLSWNGTTVARKMLLLR